VAPDPSTPYELSASGTAIIHGYNARKPFSSFFPGVAGEDGIPLWLFYVNRGQCVCSMGVQDKQHPILEYLPATWAYQLVSTQGFRTFVRLPEGFHEPFQPPAAGTEAGCRQRLLIEPGGLSLEEENPALGLDFTVEYFQLPGESYAGLVRVLRVRNRRPEPVTLELLDGLPLIIPYGVDNDSLKHMRRTIEAFVVVDNLERDAPFFRASVEPADRPDARPIERGNFYLGFADGPDGPRLVPPVVDPRRVFGTRTDYLVPEGFLARAGQELTRDQVTGNRLPCAMGHLRPTLAAGADWSYISLIGHSASVAALNALLPRVTARGYVEQKARENLALIAGLTRPSFLCSREPALDHYARQNFLDNTLRGGFPRTLTGTRSSTTLHLFSRKHGDLERDYNDFQLAPTRYAQGNGNYRDVNQNRRCELFFNPALGDGNLRQFYDLIQLDGYNPLIVKGLRYEVTDGAGLAEVLAAHLGPEHVERARACLAGPFSPGELLERLDGLGCAPRGRSDAFLGDLLGLCESRPEAEHGEGFWTDHWTYALDLLENFLAVFPERRRAILFESPTFSWFDNPHHVLPRDERYVLRDGLPRQLDAVALDEEHAERIRRRGPAPQLARTAHGAGAIYRSTLAAKLLCLLLNRLASLDPAGVGVELEAGKPDWYDALNGLPGLLGSSLNETLELKRHAQFLLDALDGEPAEGGLRLFDELAEFLAELEGLLARPLPPFEFWDRASAAKERYRGRTRHGVAGGETALGLPRLRAFLRAALAKLDAGIAQAWSAQGIPLSYFTHEVLEHVPVPVDPGAAPARSPRGLPTFRALAFRQHALPLFLEGPVHYLRCRPGREAAQELATRIEASGLYDRALGMFKVNESLAGQPLEIGRARVFQPGWFENESIWLHMEYKYLLELLRNGLFADFQRHFRRVAVPFLDPATYGRSILENSSFLVSSANPDPGLHGTGFVARLSGATAEFIHILLLLTVGPAPFRVGPDGELELWLEPALDADLFTLAPCRYEGGLAEDGTDWELPAHSFSFHFLGEILVTYLNPALASTWGEGAVGPVAFELLDRAGIVQRIPGGVLRGEVVRRIRAREIRRITVQLGPAAPAGA